MIVSDRDIVAIRKSLNTHSDINRTILQKDIIQDTFSHPQVSAVSALANFISCIYAILSELPYGQRAV